MGSQTEWENSVDPDQLDSADVDLHCLKKKVKLGSAWKGLVNNICYLFCMPLFEKYFCCSLIQ